MSQLAFLRELDADMAAAFVDVGMGDIGTYTPPDGSPIPDCTFLIDSDLASIGQVGSVSDKVRVITLFKGQVGTPVVKGRVTVGADVYILSERAIDDESRSVWMARHE